MSRTTISKEGGIWWAWRLRRAAAIRKKGGIVSEGRESVAEREEGAAESSEKAILRDELLAEFFATFILALIGLGAVAVSVANGAYDLFGVSMIWFVAVSLAIYAAAAVSGAHLNPAVTLAFAAFTDFPWRKVVPYIVAQMVGWFVGAAALFVMFAAIISNFEAANGLVRGEPGSQLTAMIFTTYAPNPAIIGFDQAAFAQVSFVTWFLAEAIITAALVFCVFFIIEERNEGRPLANTAPAMIGLLVAVLVAFEAPISMAALNPARDLGPRILTLLAGWGEIAFPGPRGFDFLIPTVSTIVGGLIGGAVYTYLYKRVYLAPAEIGREPPEVRGE
jgi:glycerol uptake facilitator